MLNLARSFCKMISLSHFIDSLDRITRVLLHHLILDLQEWTKYYDHFFCSRLNHALIWRQTSQSSFPVTRISFPLPTKFSDLSCWQLFFGHQLSTCYNEHLYAFIFPMRATHCVFAKFLGFIIMVIMFYQIDYDAILKQTLLPKYHFV